MRTETQLQERLIKIKNEKQKAFKNDNEKLFIIYSKVEKHFKWVLEGGA